MNETNTSFTRNQMRTLRAMHSRYAEDSYYFTQTELHRLLFVRWLRETGRIDITLDGPDTSGGGVIAFLLQENEVMAAA